ncbi:AraC family transcriptional regulator [Furfurilactobacillus entadae]|uniref:AraC family transcriptional regulator n=1 Tax=Furfurilactobacillus entadae TaxID=2922307 RepID=UPI0035EFE7CF
MLMPIIRDSQLKVLWMSGRLYHRHEVVEPHHHSFAQAQLVLNGHEYTTLTTTKKNVQQALDVFPGQLILILPNTVHAFHFEHETAVLDVKFELTPDLITLIKETNQTVFPVQDPSAFKHLLNDALPAEKAQQAATKLTLDVNFKHLLLTTVFGNQQQESLLKNIDYFAAGQTSFPLLRYLQTHYSDPLTLGELADHFNYSKNYLIRQCKQVTGATPMLLLQQIRLKHAQNYLEYTDKSVNDIAIKVGLDPNYLTKSFAKTIGSHPLAYRRKSRLAHEHNITLMHRFQLQTQPAIKQSGQRD